TDELQALFQEWGFQGLQRHLREASGPAGIQQPPLFPDVELFPFGANAPAEQESGNGAAGAAPPPKWQATYHLVDTPVRFEEFFNQLQKQKRFAIDLETTGLEPLRCEIVGYAFCWKAGEAWYLPVRGPSSDPKLDPDQTLRRLRPLLEDPD